MRKKTAIVLAFVLPIELLIIVKRTSKPQISAKAGQSVVLPKISTWITPT